MKIAVAADNNQVAQHFGHCEGFAVFTAKGGAVTGEEFIPNPGHRPGFLPRFLHELGVNVIIAGGMGAGAVALFGEKGIEVITGATGAAKEAVKKYLAGELQSAGSVCREHRHGESCHN